MYFELHMVYKMLNGNSIVFNNCITVLINLKENKNYNVRFCFITELLLLLLLLLYIYLLLFYSKYILNCTLFYTFCMAIDY